MSCFVDLLLFAFWALGQPFFSQNRRKVVHMEAIDHAGIFIGALDDGNTSIAIVVSSHRRMQNPEGFNVTAVQSDYFISILCFSSISVVHMFFLWFCFIEINPNAKNANVRLNTHNINTKGKMAHFTTIFILLLSNRRF